MEREPSLIFDLLAAYIPHPTSDPQQPGPSDPQQPAWCICTKCKEMHTDIERKCCGQLLDSCVSMLPHMDAYIMQGGVLRLARRIWNDVRAVGDRPASGEDNKQFRFAAYRQFVVWQYGALARGHRVVIPSCCVWRIRDKYPDPLGQYVGFLTRRL